jgi:hypothetical protein
MKSRIFAVGATLAAALFLAVAFTQSAVAQQDTTQAGMRRMHRGMRIHADSTMPGMGMRSMRGMRGMQRMGGVRAMRGMHRAGHVGPHMLIGLKGELELTDDQVGQLEKLAEGHHALMQAQMENIRDLAESMRTARAENDFEALEKGIDEGAKLRSGMAKGMLTLEKQTLEVLSDAQRTKFETWQEGAQLFRRQGRQMREHMRGMGRGMRLHMHQPPADTTQSQ